MNAVSLSATGKLLMILLCLCGMPPSKDPFRIDVINEKGIVETVVAKATAEGFELFNKDGTEKQVEIRRDGSATSFLIVDGNKRLDLTKTFPDHDFKDISTTSRMELKAVEGGDFILTRSGDTVYVTGPAGVTLSIHR